jgi:hypothetical protein
LVIAVTKGNTVDIKISPIYTLNISFSISQITLDGKQNGFPDACFGLGITLLHTGQLNLGVT